MKCVDMRSFFAKLLVCCIGMDGKGIGKWGERVGRMRRSTPAPLRGRPNSMWLSPSAESRTTCNLRVLRGGKGARGKWKRAEEYSVAKSSMVKEGGSAVRQIQKVADWYSAKAERVAGKTKRWCKKNQNLDDCQKADFELRQFVRQRNAKRDTAEYDDEQSGGKNLIADERISTKISRQVTLTGRRLERRQCFPKAASAYSQALEVYPTGKEFVQSAKAMERCQLRMVHIKALDQGRQQRQDLRANASISVGAIEEKLEAVGELTDDEALWYSVLLNETMLGTPPLPNQNASTLTLPRTQWIAPSVRRRTAASGYESYTRLLHVPRKIAAAVARGAIRTTHTHESVPRIVMDGRVLAYGQRMRGSGVGSVACKAVNFYLPEENWPKKAPCLVCFSWHHLTAAHAKVVRQAECSFWDLDIHEGHRAKSEGSASTGVAEWVVSDSYMRLHLHTGTHEHRRQTQTQTDGEVGADVQTHIYTQDEGSEDAEDKAWRRSLEAARKRRQWTRQRREARKQHLQAPNTCSVRVQRYADYLAAKEKGQKAQLRKSRTNAAHGSGGASCSLLMMRRHRREGADLQKKAIGMRKLARELSSPSKGYRLKERSSFFQPP